MKLEIMDVNDFNERQDGEELLRALNLRTAKKECGNQSA